MENTPNPALYTEEELRCVEQHIQRHFGPFDNVLHEIVSPDIHVDIALVGPSEQHNHYTLITMGMGAAPMNVPETLREHGLQRAELLITLPPDWQLQNQDERWYWPIRWLKTLARLPGNEDTWLGWGHTVPSDGPFADNTALCALLLVSPGAFAPEATSCTLPNGEPVNFYQLIPLHQEELDYKLACNDAQPLLNRIGEENLAVVDPARENSCVPRAPKHYAKSREEIKPLLEWEGPEGCLATDRITVDGQPVGYCYREPPEEGMPDSGWRFLAGDETEAYMSDPNNSGIYALNTICNYDPDVMPLLQSPAGSAFFRGEDGILRPDTGEER